MPTLYDTKQKRIVNNESSEIIRMMYHVFDDLLPEKFKNIDLLPSDLEKQIEETNEWTYNDINNGVYKSGFATSVPHASQLPQLPTDLTLVLRRLTRRT